MHARAATVTVYEEGHGMKGSARLSRVEYCTEPVRYEKSEELGEEGELVTFSEGAGVAQGRAGATSLDVWSCTPTC